MILICSKANHQRIASDLHDVTVITDARNKTNQNLRWRSPMPIDLDQSMNCPTLKPCAGPCSGYGTRSNCPPLIVLAFAATQKTVPLPAGVAE